MTGRAQPFPLMRQLMASTSGRLATVERWMVLVTLAGEWGAVVVSSGGDLLACDCWYPWPGGEQARRGSAVTRAGVGAAGYLLTVYPQGVAAIVDHLTAEPTMLNPDRLGEAAIVGVFPVPRDRF